MTVSGIVKRNYFFTCILFILSNFAMASSYDCENGECVGTIVEKLEDLNTFYQKECIPENAKLLDLQKFHEENGLSEKCWKIMTEIVHLENLLLKHKSRIEQVTCQESANCKLQTNQSNLKDDEFQNNIKSQCTETEKKLIKSQCPQELSCTILSSALSLGGYYSKFIIPQNMLPKDCHLDEDSCAVQLASGFLRSVISFFDFSWEILKSAGRASKEKMTQFWNWVSKAEDHSSSSQLAMAKASEDDEAFNLLTNDFPSAIKNIFSAFISTLKEWMKSDVFCQKWQGQPHFSKCLSPSENFDCISCKTISNGLCAISGTVIAEIVPSFLTGGIVSAIKFGANGASKIAQSIKISEKALVAIKDSKMAKMSSIASKNIDDALKVSIKLKSAQTIIEEAIKLAGTYFSSQIRIPVKNSFSVLSNALKTNQIFLNKTKHGNFLLLGGKALKSVGKVILYPIDNPMTTFAYNSGLRSFDKIFQLKSPILVNPSIVSSALIKEDKDLEKIILTLEESKIKNSGPENLLIQEKELFKSVLPLREKILQDVLKTSSVELNDIISYLFPELKYGEIAKTLGPQEILKAEKDLYIGIQTITDVPIKEKLLKDYESYLFKGEARNSLLKTNSPSYFQILENSRISDDDRFEEAMRLINKSPETNLEREKLSLALTEAHLFAPDKGVFEYSWSDLRKKYQILLDGGFTEDEAELLIRYGLAGRPPLRQLISTEEQIFSGHAKDILDKRYNQKWDELTKLIQKKHPTSKLGLIGDWLGFTNKESETFLDNLESLYFIDYRHQVDEMDGFMTGTSKLSESGLSKKYSQVPFENYKDTRRYLQTEKPEINKDTLLEVHKRMMKGGVEGIPEEQIGLIRHEHWLGNVPDHAPIDSKTKKVIMENPYLTWVERGALGNDRYYGYIQYPNVEYVKKECLDIIRTKHESLVKEIEDYQKIQNKIKEKEDFLKVNPNLLDKPQGKMLKEEIEKLKIEHTNLSKNKFEITKKLVDALVDDVMEWFNLQRALIGEIDSPEKLEQFTNILAKFQRDLISIHPLANGNGRSTRELAFSYAMMREGLPPPRIIDTNADIYKDLKEWQQIVKNGVLASDYLVDDLTERLNFGLPIENSMELITPYIPGKLELVLKDGKRLLKTDGGEFIDPRLYREIFKRELGLRPELKERLKIHPLETWNVIHERAREIFSKNNLYYVHPKNGLERVGIGYADDDFKLLFGHPSFKNKALFDFKMKNWHTKDITWRGMASTTQVKNEDDIIKMFKELTTHNASNKINAKLGSNALPDNIRHEALKDFENYNEDVFGEGLVEMAKDHSETGPLYKMSYGYSTSKNKAVGKAFAMGAMVVGDYGAHTAPELQALLKSRILVGARRATKDVDLTRLKQTHEEFSYKFGRQQEVMGIGASDPDAITIVQTIDANGEVMISYLRHPNNPGEVLVIKGDTDPDSMPKPEEIMKTIHLGNK